MHPTNTVFDEELVCSQKYWYFSYFSGITCCGYSLEVPCRGDYNEFPQHMFSQRKKIFTCFSFVSSSMLKIISLYISELDQSLWLCVKRSHSKECLMKSDQTAQKHSLIKVFARSLGIVSQVVANAVNRASYIVVISYEIYGLSHKFHIKWPQK